MAYKMYDEMMEQPNALRKTFDLEASKLDIVSQKVVDVDKIYLVGCGSSISTCYSVRDALRLIKAGYTPEEIQKELIEEGNDVKINQYLDDNLSKYKDIDNVVLGCTHYPLIKKNIRRVLGNVKFFDGSLGVSKELVRQLELRGITFDNKSFSVDFIDSSNNSNKRVRFMELMSSSYE